MRSRLLIRWKRTWVLAVGLILGVTASSLAQSSNAHMGIPQDVDPIHQTYLPIITDDFNTMMQNMFNFPPAPKLNVFGKLDPDKATDLEMLGVAGL